MKKVLILFFAVITFLQGFTQNEPAESATKPEKFFFGLNYDYLQADMKLLSMSKHSVWDNQDLGTVDLSQDEIDTINSYMDYTEKVHNVSLMAGMVLLNKPGGSWYMDGRIFAGFASRNNIILNTDNDTAEVRIKSAHFSPSFGLGFNFRYRFTGKWAIHFGVNSLYSFGTKNEIDENIFQAVSFMEEDRKDRYSIPYSTACLMASFSVKKITLQAGPGFYYLFNKNEYHIVRSGEKGGSTYEDSLETTLRPDMFVNGCLELEWAISNQLRINAGAGIGKDIAVNAGLIYFL